MDKLKAYRRPAEPVVPETMQAVVLSGAGWENLAVREVPVPEIGDSQLLCRVDAAGVCTSNLKLIAQGSDHPFLNGWDLARYPIILGDEGALTVVRVGRQLAGRYRVGERYAIQPAVDVAPINYRERYRDGARGMTKCAVGYTLGGNMAQYIRVQEEVLEAQCLIPLPSELPYFAVSMAEPISCVFSGQERHVHMRKDGPMGRREPRLGLLPGGTALVVGAGAMGRIHVEMAMRFRPRNLLVSDVLQDRLDRVEKTLGEKAKSLGINLATVRAEALAERLEELTAGAGADDIVLAVGVQAVQQNALGLLARGGVASLFGGLPRGKHMLQLDGIAVHYNEIKVVGSSGGEPSDMLATLEAIARGDLNPGNYVCGVGSLRHAPAILEGIREAKVDGRAILYPHAGVETFQLVDGWDARREEQFLARNLF